MTGGQNNAKQNDASCIAAEKIMQKQGRPAWCTVQFGVSQPGLSEIAFSCEKILDPYFFTIQMLVRQSSAGS